MILHSLLLLTSVSSAILEPAALSPATENISRSDEKSEPVFNSLLEPAIYLGAGIFFGSATLLSGAGWLAFQVTPWGATIGNELKITSGLFGIASKHAFAQVFKTSPLFAYFFREMPSSHFAWAQNKKLLSEIPASSIEDQELLNFLEKHWLAKVTGCYPFHVNWLCPSFGIPFQLHPESTNSYARDPATKCSETYYNRVEEWKKWLPHPNEFPLILTRPFNIQAHLPSCYEILPGEPIDAFVKRVKSASHNSQVILDLTAALNGAQGWRLLEDQLLKSCQVHQVNSERLLCMETIRQGDIGGIRILPLSSTEKEKIEKQHEYLLEWVSRFGLTANRIELDRPFFSHDKVPEQKALAANTSEFASGQEWVHFLEFIENGWNSKHPQKTFMFKATVQILKALAEAVPEAKWQEVMNSPTRSAIVQLSLKKIKQELNRLVQEEEKVSFHHIATRVEQIHADFTSLLEVFSPFTSKDFPDIYRRHLTSIPQALQPLTRYAIHSSGMTSLGAIFQTVEKTLGRTPRILYGEHTYFEIVNLSKRLYQASSMEQAKEQDWKDVDLLLVQFCPTVRRVSFKITEYQATEYRIEKVAQSIHQALKARDGKPLIVALDSTLDYSNSKRVSELLTEFQKEIEQGALNIICYRSGLKFDLFGMDNYCGAPLFMVHNQDEKWASFDSLLTDPALQTDRLSLNWFCLAIQYAAPYLEAYRQQIFENTRAVLNKIPPSLLDPANPNYRVIPMQSDVDPSFIDIKIFGPLHGLRGDLLVGVYLTVKCMEAGYPLLYRPGIGFYHLNLAMLFGDNCTTVRLTIGLDPAQIDVIVGCLEQINACNGQY